MLTHNQTFELTRKELIHIFTCNDKDCSYCNFKREQLGIKIEEVDLKNDIISPEKKQRVSRIGWSNEELKKAIDLRNQGRSYGEIGNKLGKSKGSVYIKLKNQK